MLSKQCFTTLVCIFTLILFSSSFSFAQGVHPQNLFDAGLNIAYLSGHQTKGANQSEAPIWAGNASAEWLGSWMPGAVSPITPDLADPEPAHLEMVNTMKNMKGCGQAYFSLRLSIYNLGYTLGWAVVETGYDCTACLQIQMQKAAVEARTIGQFLTSVEWQQLSTELNNNAQALNANLQGELAVAENGGRFGYLQSVLDKVNQLLPDELIPCENSPNESTATNEDQGDKPQKERHRKMIIMVGTTGATLEGNAGSTSNSGNGFYAGFDIEMGKKIFFNSGVDFFRNSAGKEYFVLLPGQIADPGEYIQAFRLNLGLGGYVFERENKSLCLFGNARILSATSINGDLSSYGLMKVEDRPVHLNFGTRLNIKFFTVQLLYEFGLSPILTSPTEDFEYRIWQLGVGVNF